MDIFTYKDEYKYSKNYGDVIILFDGIKLLKEIIRGLFQNSLEKSYRCQHVGFYQS